MSFSLLNCLLALTLMTWRQMRSTPFRQPLNRTGLTRTELYASLTKLKKLIAKRLKREGAASQTELTEEENALYEEFVNVFEENEFVY